MSLPSPTVTSSFPALTFPTALAPPGWLLPAALNTAFVSDFNAGLSTATNSIDWGNGTITQYPPVIFGSHGSRPDIILDSIYGLTFEQRVASTKPANSFGRDEVKVSIRSSNTIALDWEGGEEKVVAMTCHSCLRYNLQTQNVFDACQRCTHPINPIFPSNTSRNSLHLLQRAHAIPLRVPQHLQTTHEIAIQQPLTAALTGPFRSPKSRQTHQTRSQS